MTSTDSFQPKLVRVCDQLTWTEYVPNPSTHLKLNQLTGNNHKQAFASREVVAQTC